MVLIGFKFVDELQRVMEDIELDLSDFKKNQRLQYALSTRFAREAVSCVCSYEELAAEELHLQRGLEAMEERIEVFSGGPVVPLPT